MGDHDPYSRRASPCSGRPVSTSSGVDMEHSPFSMETVADMATLARALDFPMVVRPPEGNREWITRLLDAGVWNLHVPQVGHAGAGGRGRRVLPLRSAGRARHVRLRPHTEYRTLPRPSTWPPRTPACTSRSCCETRRAFDRLDEIAVGPGHRRPRRSARPTWPRTWACSARPLSVAVLDEHRRRLVAAARKHGKAVAMITDSVEGVRQMIALGATIINYSSDTAALRSVYASVVEEIRRT